MKNNSGIDRSRKKSSAIDRAEKIIKKYAKQGIISLEMVEGITSAEDRGKLYELIDRYYPALEGFSVTNYRGAKTGDGTERPIRYYKLTMKLPNGEKYSLGKMNYPMSAENPSEEIARRAHVKLNMYGQVGRVLDKSGNISKPFGYWEQKANVEDAISKGWEVPPGVLKYYGLTRRSKS